MRLKIKGILILLAAALLSAVSCSKASPEEDIILSAEAFHITNSGQEDLKIKISARVEWTAYSDSSWIIITSEPKGGEGKSTLVFKVKRSYEYSRKGYIVIKTADRYYRVPVTQGASNSNGNGNNPGGNM